MIHGDNPFVDDPDSRDPVRRFRGRLSAPVTIFTSGEESERTGLTVSSLLVIEGDQGFIEAVVGPTTDLWDLVEETGRFVVHVCTDEHRSIAQVFAGLRPSPGGIFSGLEVTQSEWGPVIGGLGNRAFCSYESKRELGHTGLVTAHVDHIEAADLTNPLAYFRGSFRSLS